MKLPPLKAALLAALLAACSTSVQAGDWFLHEFGELRSYHGDWLNVCRDKGEGDCRAVQIALKPGDDTFFGESQVTVHVSPDGEFQIEVFQRNMSTPVEGIISFCFDEVCSGIGGPEGWRFGSKDATNVAETFVITDKDVAALTVERMIANNKLEVVHGPYGSEMRARFSLRGVTAALNAIEQHYKDR
ncbi:MAG: hypothetical protein AAFY73_10575 [Pseudomonadota bacterium]